MSDSAVSIVVPEPYFTLFETSRRDLPAVVIVNRALLSFAHLDVFPWHLACTIEAEELAEKGMPSPEESEILLEIGDKIEEALLGYNALFLARSTWDGLRTLVFRVHNPDVADATLKTLIAQEQRRPWEYHMESDPGWEGAGIYFQMFAGAEGHDA